MTEEEDKFVNDRLVQMMEMASLKMRGELSAEDEEEFLNKMRSEVAEFQEAQND